MRDNILSIETEGFNVDDANNPDRFSVSQVDINITTSYAEGKFQGRWSAGGLIGAISGSKNHRIGR